MRWNWTQEGWPHFRYDSEAIKPREEKFPISSGEIVGAVRHVTGDDRDRLRIELLSEEAVRTSAIVEGEVLDRFQRPVIPAAPVRAGNRRHAGEGP